MDASGGAVRARHMKSLLASVARLAPDDAAAVRERVRADLLESIADATGPEWMPLVVNAQFTRAVHDALPGARFEAFFRSQALDLFRSPLLRAIVDGAVAVFGLDPGSAVRFLPRGWDAVFRDCGTWTKPRLVAPAHAEMDLEALPRMMVVDDVWPRSVAASLSVIVDISGMTGGMRLVSLDAEAGRARYALRWGSADAPPTSR